MIAQNTQILKPTQSNLKYRSRAPLSKFFLGGREERFYLTHNFKIFRKRRT